MHKFWIFQYGRMAFQLTEKNLRKMIFSDLKRQKNPYPRPATYIIYIFNHFHTFSNAVSRWHTVCHDLCFFYVQGGYAMCPTVSNEDKDDKDDDQDEMKLILILMMMKK